MGGPSHHHRPPTTHDYQNSSRTSRTGSRATRAKKDALDNLDTLLPQTIAAMEQNGFHVYVAEESSQAADYIAAPPTTWPDHRQRGAAAL